MNQLNLSVCLVIVALVAASVSCTDEDTFDSMKENEKGALEGDANLLLGIADSYLKRGAEITSSVLNYARARFAVNSHHLRTIERVRRGMITQAMARSHDAISLKGNLLEAHQRAYEVLDVKLEEIVQSVDTMTIIGKDIVDIETMLVRRIEQVKNLKVPESRGQLSPLELME